jgi:hypothetical protein
MDVGRNSGHREQNTMRIPRRFPDHIVCHSLWEVIRHGHDPTYPQDHHHH